MLSFLRDVTEAGQRSELFRDVVKAAAPSSPAAALKLAGQISEPKLQIEALTAVAAALLTTEDAQKPN